MNFEFSEDHILLKDQAKKFLSNKCPPSTVRTALDNDAAYNTALWQSIIDMGWTATVIPEEHGGLGLSYLELAVIAEELGRSVAPIPFSSTVYLATEALLLAGSPAQQSEWLPRLADGSAIGCFALPEDKGRREYDALKTRYSDGKISGKKLMVADGEIADFCVVVAKNGDDHKAGLYLVELNQKSIHRQPKTTLDMSRNHCDITFDHAEAQPLNSGTKIHNDLINTLLNRAAVLFAWEQIGSADNALTMAKEYSLERYAFGRPIGSYQALKHKMAHMYAKNTLARSNCYYGLWALNTDASELPIAAATARLSATQALYFASKENIQIHGGAGFTWEFDCHLHYRRGKLLAMNLGSEALWQDKLIHAIQQTR